MKRKILISVIVPVYNTEEYLDDCLKSLTKQTFQDIEIICINDASTDNSWIKLTEWESIDERIRIVNLKENIRQGGARNIGILQAKGEYIAFVDSDDFVHQEMYNILYKNSNNGAYDIVVGEKHCRYGNEINEEFNFPTLNKDSYIEKIKKHILVHGCPIWNSIIRKQVIIENNLFFPENTYYEDNAVATLFFACAKSIKVVQAIPLYYYRVTNVSTTRRKEDIRYFERMHTATLFLENAKRVGVYELYKEEIDYAFFLLYYQNTILGALERFKVIPKENIKKIITSYPSYLKKCIKNNKYYKINKPSSVINAVVYFPYCYSVLIPLCKKIDGVMLWFRSRKSRNI